MARHKTSFVNLIHPMAKHVPLPNNILSHSWISYAFNIVTQQPQPLSLTRMSVESRWPHAFILPRSNTSRSQAYWSLSEGCCSCPSRVINNSDFPNAFGERACACGCIRGGPDIVCTCVVGSGPYVARHAGAHVVVVPTHVRSTGLLSLHFDFYLRQATSWEENSEGENMR